MGFKFGDDDENEIETAGGTGRFNSTVFLVSYLAIRCVVFFMQLYLQFTGCEQLTAHAYYILYITFEQFVLAWPIIILATRGQILQRPKTTEYFNKKYETTVALNNKIMFTTQ